MSKKEKHQQSNPDQQPRWRRILLNKYLIAGVIFLVFIFFLDQTNFLVTLRLQKRVHQLHQEEKRLQQEIDADSIRVGRLVGNMEELERFGREEYYMKRADEEIFVISDDESDD